MLKLVSVVFMFFVTVQCWAAPWDGSITSNNAWSPAQQDPGQEQQEIRHRIRVLVGDEMRLAGQVARMEAEANETIMNLPERERSRKILRLGDRATIQAGQQYAREMRLDPLERINRITNRIIGMLIARDTILIERQRQQAIREEQERHIAVQREFQTRQRTAIRMMEQVQQLQQEDGWISGCSVM
ncbi:MAG: hypothetical protein LBD19_02820 [Endomicrobium sp.]|nr:hypothetical protein [Endomicrobium sp.]